MYYLIPPASVAVYHMHTTRLFHHQHQQSYLATCYGNRLPPFAIAPACIELVISGIVHPVPAVGLLPSTTLMLETLEYRECTQPMGHNVRNRNHHRNIRILH